MAAVSHSSRSPSISQPPSTTAAAAAAAAPPSKLISERAARRDLTSRFRLSTAGPFSLPPDAAAAAVSPSSFSPSASPGPASAAAFPPPAPPALASPHGHSVVTTASAYRAHHSSSQSVDAAALSSSSAAAAAAAAKPPRPGSLLAFATAAIDRTQSALASAEQKIRTRPSASRLSLSPDAATTSTTAPTTAPVLSSSSAEPSEQPVERTPSNAPSPAAPSADAPAASSLSPVPSSGDPAITPSAAAATPLSSTPAYARPYSEADPSFPPPIRLPRVDNKMHQTSSRLLRMTEDDRPFTKDFQDLYATLIVSLLPLGAHRVRLSKIEHTFLSEDAINNLGSLKFSQSNRMPDPKDPSRIVTTTTTTTFSMAKDMARSICQRFLDARLIESADGRYQQVFALKGGVWQLTPKGISILDRFCSRNGIQQRQVGELVGHAPSQLVLLERDPKTDKVVSDRGTVEVIFRRFTGVNGLNVKTNLHIADADSLSDYRDGLTGVRVASERKIAGKTYRDTFTGKAAIDWLMDCCTTVDRREAADIASYFVEHGLIEAVQYDRLYQNTLPGPPTLFQPTKNAVYQMTPKGRDLFSGVSSRGRSSESDGGAPVRAGIARDSNTQRLDKILNDAALRLLFRENLRETHCEENLSFYLDVDDFVRNCRQSIRQAQKNPGAKTMDGIKEIMAQAYGIYNAFLAPGSPCELNIDHQLRSNLAMRMTKAVGQDGQMISTLHEVTSLFEDAQNAVFKLMASDSVPKFLRHPKYEHTLRNYDFDAIVVGGRSAPERSQSRSNRK